LESIYLDHHATTPVDARVLKAMEPFLKDQFANAGSSHLAGRRVRKYVNLARDQVSALLHCNPSEVLFTSGATESNNMAIHGVAKHSNCQGKHIITTKIEHSAVLFACQALEEEGFEVTYLPVGKDGIVSPDAVKDAIRTGEKGTTGRTVLVTIMGANNEIGTIQPISEIARICSNAGVLFHVDAAQYIGKLPVNVKDLGPDLMSFSGHKMYAPKGIGGLYVNSASKCALCVRPIMHGGGQEGGLRPGTVPVAMVVGLGKAAEIAQSELEASNQKETQLRNWLWEKLQANLEGLKINGCFKRRLPGNLNICIDGIDGELLMLRLGGIAVSTGSACSGKSSAPSHVLKALGLHDNCAYASVRMGLGRSTTKEQIEIAAEKIIDSVKKLRKLPSLR